MSEVFTDAFDDLYDSLVDARCQIRVGSHVYETAISSGIDERRTSDDLGTYDMAECTARMKESDEDARYELAKGRVIEVRFGSSSEWKKLRIESRKVSGGIITIGLNTEHE